MSWLRAIPNPVGSRHIEHGGYFCQGRTAGFEHTNLGTIRLEDLGKE